MEPAILFRHRLAEYLGTVSDQPDGRAAGNRRFQDVQKSILRHKCESAAMATLAGRATEPVRVGNRMRI